MRLTPVTIGRSALGELAAGGRGSAHSFNPSQGATTISSHMHRILLDFCIYRSPTDGQTECFESYCTHLGIISMRPLCRPTQNAQYAIAHNAIQSYHNHVHNGHAVALEPVSSLDSQSSSRGWLFRLCLFARQISNFSMFV